MNFIKFLGTAGARFVTMRQLRASGGIWLRYRATNILIDPGPGSIVRCNAARPKLDPASLDAIILTHKHLDHCGDVNVMVEAMTEGGFKKKGVLFLPQDALGPEGVVYSYLENFPQKITILKKKKFSLGEVRFQVPVMNLHSVLTAGLKFYLGKEVVSFVSDTSYFEKLIDIYRDSTILVLNTVFYKKKDQYEHLCLDESLKIIEAVRPKKAILTHFGTSMLKAKPYLLEKKIKKTLGMDIKFATDGYCLEL